MTTVPRNPGGSRVPETPEEPEGGGEKEEGTASATLWRAMALGVSPQAPSQPEPPEDDGVVEV